MGIKCIVIEKNRKQARHRKNNANFACTNCGSGISNSAMRDGCEQESPFSHRALHFDGDPLNVLDIQLKRDVPGVFVRIHCSLI